MQKETSSKIFTGISLQNYRHPGFKHSPLFTCPAQLMSSWVKGRVCPYAQPPADAPVGPLVSCVLSRCPFPTLDPRALVGPLSWGWWLPLSLDMAVSSPLVLQ